MIYEQLIRLKITIGTRNKMLILHDIGGSLCYRDKKKPIGPNGETNPNFYRNKKKYVYLRPGALDYIRRL